MILSIICFTNNYVILAIVAGTELQCHQCK